MELDQFFTRPEVAERCWAFYRDRAGPVEGSTFIEPSAGGKAFYKLLPAGRRQGYELDPVYTGPGIKQQDWLAFTPLDFVRPEGQLHVVGNPPFGKRGKLAIAFLQQAFDLGADYVGFIVPRSVIRRKFKFCHLVAASRLGDHDFVFPDGQPAAVYNCSFGVWKKGALPALDPNNPTIHQLARIHYIEMSSKRGTGREKIPKCDMFIYGAFYPAGGYGVNTVPWPGVNFGIEVVDKEACDGLYDYLAGLDWLQIAHQAMRRNYVVRSADVREVLRKYFIARHRPRTCASYINLYSIGSANKRDGYVEWGKDKVEVCDLFLPNARRHGQPIKASKEVEFPVVIGVEVKKEKDRLLSFFETFDWASVAHRSTNRNVCLNLDIVKEAVMNAGFVDDAEPSCGSFVECHTINQADWRKREGKTYGQEWIGRCDLYLPCSGFGDYMKAHTEFTQKEMVGVVVKRERKRLLSYLLGLNWVEAAGKRQGARLGITPAVIKQAVIDGGFVD